MDEYSALGIPSDPQDCLAQMLDDLATRIPGWSAAPGSLTVAQFEVVALQIARVGAALEDDALEAFAAYGQEIVQEPLASESHAFGLVTFTASHTDGVYIPVGTVIVGSDGAGGEIEFQTTQVVSINAGLSSIAGVPVESIEPGLLANPVSGAAVLSSGVEGIASVAFDAASSIGADGETLEAYAARLATKLRLLSSSPVIPDDYDVFLRTSLPAVYRVLVRNGYNPTDTTEGNAGILTVSMIDSSGAWVGSSVDADAAALILQHREANDDVRIVTPTTTGIDVSYTVILDAGYSEPDVVARVDAALSAFLAPSAWGQPPIGDEPAWVLKKTLRPMGMLGPVIGNVEGVESVQSVLACAASGTPATADITLPGHAPLTSAGTITGAEA